ncbi:KGK domain-containing protein [Nostoc sp. KVJ3]|uniref:KGK domain-containing protein n=1 Tax=Nostoc sp. KVJ3 TaxID=457945 RepID=UPI002237D33A|nr:KGK domain-containing protein [Nostoc sp. KVJ3]
MSALALTDYGFVLRKEVKEHILVEITNNGRYRRRKSKIEVDKQDEFKQIECNDGDVLDFGDNIYKVAKLKQAIDTSYNSHLVNILNEELRRKGVDINNSLVNLFQTGTDCEILTLGSQSWKKGKVKIKISVEFYVEEEDLQITNSNNSQITEPESPLDDLRRMINE